jgi:hypothetical protein
MKSGFVMRGIGVLALFAVVFSSALSAQVEPAFVREGVKWDQYTKFLVKPLVVDEVKVLKPPYAQDDPTQWTLELRDLAGVQSIFRDVMRDELQGNGGYPLVYADGKDVIEVEVELLSIMPWLKPGGDDEYAGYEVKTLGSGEITARVELRDSTTRELLVLIEGDKAVGEKYKEFTRANNVSNVESMFRAFARNLRKSMDKVHGK